MLLIEEAMELIKEHCIIQKNEIIIPTEEAYGCILAYDIYSEIYVPEFPKSAMDGYAVSSKAVRCADKDSPVNLKVIGEVLAGEYCNYKILPGEAVRIMTGAMMPQGADSVVKQEDTDYGMQEVNIYKAVLAGENYCKIGEDITKGDLIIKKHTKLNAVHIGILSSIGLDTVTILAPMKAALLISGDELTAPGSPLEAGKIYNSIGAVLKTKLKEMRFQVVHYSLCPDEKEAMKEKINESINKADILITTGGVSVGKKDLIPGLLSEMGASVLFHRVKIKPGTPVMMSLYKGRMILSLSGNPFAALVTFDVFFSKIAAIFMQNEMFMPVKGKAVYQGDTLKPNKQRRYIRAYVINDKAVLDNNLHNVNIQNVSLRHVSSDNCSTNISAIPRVTTAVKQSSSVLSVMADLNCYIIQPEDMVIEDGNMVEFIMVT